MNKSSSFFSPLPYDLRTRGIPLTGSDHFLQALECESRQFHNASHLAQVVLRLGPGFDPEQFCQYIATLHRNIPFFAASIRPRWGGRFGPAVYHRSNPPDSVPVHRHAPASCKPLPQAQGFPKQFQHLLSTGPLHLQKDPLIRFDLLGNEGSTDLAVTWLQMLFDGEGILQFLSLLSAAENAEEFLRRLNWEEEVQSPLELPSIPERIKIQTEWFQKMKDLARPSPGSPAGPLSRTPKCLRYEVTRFSPSETAQLDERAREEAGILSPMIFYLAISMRAHHRIFARRNEVPDRYLVPVAVDLRPRSDINPIFRNHVSFLWFYAAPSDLHPRTELIKRLLEQKRDQMNTDFPGKTAVALENSRYLPSSVNRRIIRSQTEGELCSFFFAYTGAFFDGMSQLCGGEFIDGFPAPGVPPSPGSSFIWSEINGQLNLTYLFQKGTVSSAERDEAKKQIDRERRN